MNAHHFVSVAFKSDFPTGKFSPAWSNSHHITDSKSTLAKSVLGGGTVYAFPFGVLTFVNVDPRERIAEIDNLEKELGVSLRERITSEDLMVEENSAEKPRVEFSKVLIDKLTNERSAVFALILAQSAAMEYYEGVVTAQKEKMLQVVFHLQNTGSVPLRNKKLNKFVAEAMAIRMEVVGVLHLLDKPELIWEDLTMDKLYEEFRANFDLGDRFLALEHKLQTLQDTSVLLLDTVRDSRLYNADVVIVILIVIEIVFSLLTRFHLFGW